MVQFSVGGNGYAEPFTTTYGRQGETPPRDFPQAVQAAYANPVTASCLIARQRVFSDARFQFRQLNNGRPGKLFGTPDLAMLEKPWTNGTTGELLGRMLQDTDLAGNFYMTQMDGQFLRMRPDWVTIVTASRDVFEPTSGEMGTLGVELVGYLYCEPQKRAVFFAPGDVCHFSPIPDPMATFKGMSLLHAAMSDLLGDEGMSAHKRQFMDHAATPNMVIKFDPTVDPDAIEAFEEIFEDRFVGAMNAYKTMFLGGGADLTVVGKDFEQMDFKNVQGHGETRIAAALRVPAIIAGLSEGMDAATYSNYGQARRHWADGELHPLWRMASAALEPLVTVPPGAQLWYDARDIPFLREDEGDSANILNTKAQAISALVKDGYTADSVVKAIDTGDLTLLQHSGLFSVQLQTPGSTAMPLEPPATEAAAEAAIAAGGGPGGAAPMPMMNGFAKPALPAAK
jgi:phage portal protein BeeE